MFLIPTLYLLFGSVIHIRVLLVDLGFGTFEVAASKGNHNVLHSLLGSIDIVFF